MSQNKSLIFSRTIWEIEAKKVKQYNFTKEELDAAEKKEVKFIGSKNGVDCYLPKLFK